MAGNGNEIRRDAAAAGLIGGEQAVETTSWPRTGAVRSHRPEVSFAPAELPRLLPDAALATVELPLHLNWSDPGRRFDLCDRRQRARLYEIVLREGDQDDIDTYVDAGLLVDLWDELVLPSSVRDAWSGLVSRATGAALSDREAPQRP